MDAAKDMADLFILLDVWAKKSNISWYLTK